jgi:hypothetical protein
MKKEPKVGTKKEFKHFGEHKQGTKKSDEN